MEQTIINSNNNYEELDSWLEGKKKVLLVCDDSIKFLPGIRKKLDTVNLPIVSFSKFQPNPLYESVVEGVRLFRAEGCDSIIAVGGGSAMDVAKCIKLYSKFPGDGAEGAWLKADVISNNIPFLAMPTTAGTGSEATRYAVVYYGGAKQSLTSESFIPGTILMDPNALSTLPLYQKKATMLDALCHAIESYWSVNSTDESKEYSKKAVSGILENLDAYLNNDKAANRAMMTAAHYAGKAINVTQTTAGHAMCYKLTSLYGVAHGHAAALVDTKLFPYMVSHTADCVDPRGEEYLKEVFEEIAGLFGCRSVDDACAKLQDLFDTLELKVPEATEEDYKVLKTSVNPVRLKNNPVKLTEDSIDSLYRVILK